MRVSGFHLLTFLLVFRVFLSCQLPIQAETQMNVSKRTARFVVVKTTMHKLLVQKVAELMQSEFGKVELNFKKRNSDCQPTKFVPVHRRSFPAGRSEVRPEDY